VLDTRGRMGGLEGRLGVLVRTMMVRVVQIKGRLMIVVVVLLECTMMMSWLGFPPYLHSATSEM